MARPKKEQEIPVDLSIEPGYAIEGNLVILTVTKASFGLDLTPQGRTKASTWGSFEPSGQLLIVFEMLDADFQVLEDGRRVLTQQGLKNLFGRIGTVGVPGTRTGYNEMLQRDEDF